MTKFIKREILFILQMALVLLALYGLKVICILLATGEYEFMGAVNQFADGLSEISGFSNTNTLNSFDQLISFYLTNYDIIIWATIIIGAFTSFVYIPISTIVKMNKKRQQKEKNKRRYEIMNEFYNDHSDFNSDGKISNPSIKINGRARR